MTDSDRDLILRAANKLNYTAKPGKGGAKRNASVRDQVQTSYSLSCDPSQVKEFNENARKAGLTNVHYDKDGTCHVPAFGRQRKELLKLRGLVDFGAAY